jgi:hypothetical protein
VTSSVFTLVLANVAYWLVGVGAFLALGIVDKRESTWAWIPAAYLFGIAAVVLPASYLALLGIGVGWTEIAVAAAAIYGAAWWRLRRQAPRPRSGAPRRSSLGWIRIVVTGALFAVAAWVLVVAGRAFVVSPLVMWDGWVVWAMKARVLYELPGDAAGILRGSTYGAPSYPIAMPELEALGFRALGRFDGTVIDLQLLGLAFGLLGAMWSLSRNRARSVVVGIAALAVVTAPQFLVQLGTNYVDIPLAVYVAAMLLAAARWLTGDDGPGALTCFVVFGGMAAMLKNEGTMFATAAILALLLTTALSDRGRLRRALVASAAVLAIALPWRLYGAAYDVPTPDYDLRNLFDPGFLADHAERVRPVVSELVSEMTDLGRWGLLSYACALALLAGLVAARRAVGLFALTWAVLAFAGLVWTYWVSTLSLTGDLGNTSNRTVDSIVIGITCLAPMLVDDGIAAVLGSARGTRLASGPTTG